MSAIGSAPAKAILVGEHAVVYGYPAIAIPIPQARVRAEARFIHGRPAGHVSISAPAVQLQTTLEALDSTHPMAALIRLALQEMGVQKAPAFALQIESSIPVAAGLGSSAAVSVAVLRALAGLFERHLPTERLSALAYQVERIHHGTPSGIDNTVVSVERPILFVRGRDPVPLAVAAPMAFLLAYCGVASSTGEAVARVRRAYQRQRENVEQIFRRIRACVDQALEALEQGNPVALGAAMDRNHAALVELGLDIPQTAALVQAALDAGAIGAKITGAGLGGNVIALVDEQVAKQVRAALEAAGAERILDARIEP
jgi:mevalonate kinase